MSSTSRLHAAPMTAASTPKSHTTTPVGSARTVPIDFENLEMIRTRLAELDGKADGAVWDFAVFADMTLEALKKQDPKRTDESLYETLSAGLRFTRETFKVRAITHRKLREWDLGEVAKTRVSGFSQIAAILMKSGLDEKSKKKLVKAVVKHDTENLGNPYTVEEVWTKIRELKAISTGKPLGLLATDFWSFTDFDERFGQKGTPDRFSGQAAEQLIRRFLPENGRVFAAFLGSGTVLDVMKAMQSEPDYKAAEYRGMDLVIADRVKEAHGDMVRAFDAAQSNWRAAIGDDWGADLTFLTPPTFGGPASENVADFGNIKDPAKYLAAHAAIARGVLSITKPGGVVALVTGASSKFESVPKFPDHEFQVLRTFHDAKAVGEFVGRIVVKVGNVSAKAAKDTAFPVAAIRHVHLFRTPA